MACATTTKDQDISHANAILEYAMRITKEDTIKDGENKMSKEMITTSNHEETSIQEKIERSDTWVNDKRSKRDALRERSRERESSSDRESGYRVVAIGIALQTRMRMIMTFATTSRRY